MTTYEQVKAIKQQRSYLKKCRTSTSLIQVALKEMNIEH